MAELAEVTAEQLEFRDPFNHTYSQQQYLAILEDMFSRIGEVRFKVHHRIQQQNSGYISWTFSGTTRLTGSFSFEGCSRLEADEKGCIRIHYDYWDGSELIELLPLLGAIVRRVKQKMAH